MVNGPPVGEAVNATFRSNNAENLDRVVQEIKETLESTRGLQNVKIQDVQGDREIHVEMDYQQGRSTGFKCQFCGQCHPGGHFGKEGLRCQFKQSGGGFICSIVWGGIGKT